MAVHGNHADVFSSPLVLRVTYNEEFEVIYTGETNPDVIATAATIVAPSSCTHSFNMNQRVIKLVIVAHDTANHRLRLRAPPSANHFPPQMGMLFLLNGKAYSKAAWITVAR